MSSRCCRYKVHAFSSGAMEDSDAEVRLFAEGAALRCLFDALRLQVTLYGVGKDPAQFHVEHDGKVADGWWHVVNIKVSEAGKVTLEDVDDTSPIADD